MNLGIVHFYSRTQVPLFPLKISISPPTVRLIQVPEYFTRRPSQTTGSTPHGFRMTTSAPQTEMATGSGTPSPAKAAWTSPLPILLLQLLTDLTTILQQTFHHPPALLLQQGMGLRLRWGKFKDALFYEMVLLLLQPNPVMLILMWPGWIVVLAVVVWRWWAGAGDAV
ncbi:hypothetical protein HOY80DRAFT_964417 [Tuber brumale]|nr:hypothetical protein HOY80DRAFT_964417 [Tuber brumale]